MEEKVIKLSRNIFCLQLRVFLPLVILFGLGGWFLYALRLDNDWDKTFVAIGFVVEILAGFLVAKETSKTIVFTDNSVELRSKNKVLKSFPVDSIKGFVCNDKRKTIKVLTHNNTEDYLLKFGGGNALGGLIYFNVKTELCKAYPTKSNDLRDEYVEKFLNGGEIPQFIQVKHKSEYCGVIVGIIFGFILAILPIGETVLATIWALLEIMTFGLKLFVYMLNLLP